MFRALWQYRGLAGSLVRREFRIRSLRAMWGSAWLVIQPGIQIFIYTVIFAGVLRAKLPGVDDGLAYGLYLCAGLLTWNYFADVVGRSQTLFLDHAYLLRAVRFPRSTLPLALLVSATLQFAVVAAIFLLVLLVSGRWPGWVLLGALPLLVVQAALGVGIGLLSGTLNVFYRDVGQGMGVALQFWFWLTPIVYPASIVPETARRLLAWNPLYPLASGYQRIVVERAWPAFEPCAGAAVLAALVLLSAWGVFRALATDLVDEL